MWNIIMISWMIGFMILATINLIYGTGRKWKFTWSHFFWFMIGMVFVAIPYQYILHITQ
jgi:hypothetical protein